MMLNVMKNRLETPYINRIFKITQEYTEMGDLTRTTFADENLIGEFYKATKTYFSITTPQEFHTTFFGFSDGKRAEIVKWVKENCSDTVWYCQYKLWFKTPDEGLAFVIRWF